jgi:polysaccharide biosynthesis protein PslL
MTPSRNKIIDIAKGIGIILVVFGHNWIVENKPGELFRIVFSFHVPLFFFLSGIFLKESESLQQFISAKTDSLLKPYLVVLTILGIGTILFHPTDVFTYFFGVIYASYPTIEWGHMWFLPHLFVSLLFSRGILHTTKYSKHRSRWIAGIATFMAIVGIAFINIFWQIDISKWSHSDRLFGNIKYLPGLPFSIDLIGISSACILFGFLARQKVKSIAFNLPIFSIALLTFSLLHYYFNPTMDLALRMYGYAPISSLLAILGVYIVIAISALLDRQVVLSKLLAYIGSSSLFILIFHGRVQNITFGILSQLNKFAYFNGIVSLIIAIIVPIVLLEITKRQPLLSAILLPRKLHS